MIHALFPKDLSNHPITSAKCHFISGKCYVNEMDPPLCKGQYLNSKTKQRNQWDEVALYLDTSYIQKRFVISFFAFVFFPVYDLSIFNARCYYSNTFQSLHN